MVYHYSGGQGECVSGINVPVANYYVLSLSFRRITIIVGHVFMVKIMMESQYMEPHFLAYIDEMWFHIIYCERFGLDRMILNVRKLS